MVLVRIHICFIILFYFCSYCHLLFFILLNPRPLMSPQSLVFSTSPSPLLIFLCPFPDPAPIISHPFITLPCSLWLALCLCVIQSLHPLHHSFPCHVLRSLQHFFFLLGPGWGTFLTRTYLSSRATNARATASAQLYLQQQWVMPAVWKHSFKLGIPQIIC